MRVVGSGTLSCVLTWRSLVGWGQASIALGLVKQSLIPRGAKQPQSMAAAMMSLSSLNVAALPQCDGLARQGLALAPARSSGRKIVASSRSRVVMSAKKSDREEQGSIPVAQLTALALAASAVIPEFAEAAITPSLKNLLLSVAAGFGVLGALVVAVLGVATFDPVKRS
ncbi:uncharacterized protein LOC112346246 [Selaginella moellendorffii]|uniref:uncharacterized protein LOC112346246 n=1 Tax=Selaginella moellendorffii TaxID=88036 RepID=UPI000D1C2D00|nr:uncharacterized protein LOC112346246 [Selaginella moellendorffii]|eukprot:XP_024530469.1 uncharacterized protein LOC112346246 [Selaginella moellendorffii]